MNNHYFILLIIAFVSCKSADVKNVNPAQLESETNIPKREYSVQSVLWQQLSGEYKALCYQAFNLAKLQLDKILLENNDQEKPLAIIADIDETLLDNSPFNAKMIKTDKEYSKESWVEWGLLKNAKPVPGAVEFLKYAESKGVQVFYISNRYVVQQEETKENLAKVGFPFVDDDHIFLREKSSGKEERRKMVVKDNKVVMLFGDNLSDFAEIFDGKRTKERNQIVESFKDRFGAEFIVLPNPMYGDWENKGLYEGSYNWSPAQKDSLRKAKLISY